MKRFSLRALLVVTAVLGVSAGVIGSWRQKAIKQKTAVAEISAALTEEGVQLEFEYVRDSGPLKYVEGFLPFTLGPNWTSSVRTLRTSVSFSVSGNRLFSHDKRQKVLKRISDLPSLEELDLSLVGQEGCGGTLRALPRLRSLKLHSDRLTENDIDAIGELTNLTALLELYVQELPKADCVERMLSRLPRLVQLGMASPNLRGESLAPIGNMTDLSVLRLDSPDLRYESLGFLERLSKLEYLDLRSENLDAKSMEIVARLPRLRWLVLTDTRIGDEGLRALSKSVTLDYVTINQDRLIDSPDPKVMTRFRLDRSQFHSRQSSDDVSNGDHK